MCLRCPGSPVTCPVLRIVCPLRTWTVRRPRDFILPGRPNLAFLKRSLLHRVVDRTLTLLSQSCGDDTGGVPGVSNSRCTSSYSCELRLRRYTPYLNPAARVEGLQDVSYGLETRLYGVNKCKTIGDTKADLPVLLL